MKKIILLLIAIGIYPLSRATISNTKEEPAMDKRYEAEYYKELTRLQIEKIKALKCHPLQSKCP